MLTPAFQCVFMSCLNDLAGRRVIAEIADSLAELTIENVGKALMEGYRVDEVLEIGRVHCAANGSGRIPGPSFEGGRCLGGPRQATAGSALFARLSRCLS